MSPNFNQQILEVTRQVNSYIKKGRIIPNKLLDYYNNLLSVEFNIKNNSNENVNLSKPLIRFSYDNFTNTYAVEVNNDINFLVIQNTGTVNIYFSPVINNNTSEVLTASNALVLSPGGNWSSDKKEFITKGLLINSQTQSGSKLIGYFIGNPPQGGV